MKKLFFGGLILSLLGIGIISCNKKDIKIDNLSEQQSIELSSSKLDISLEEFEQIINSENSLQKSPPWVEKFKRWIKAHSGTSQQFVNGQPVCHGNGGCGPCPGACFRIGIIDGGEDGQTTQEEFVLGLRSIAFSIFEKNGNPNERKMVIQIPIEYKDEFIFSNNFIVENDEVLSSFYALGAGFNSITFKAGRYPVIQNPQDGMIKTIVNISVVR